MRAVFLAAISAIFLLANDASAGRLKGKLVASSPQLYEILSINSNGRSAVASVASTGKFSISVKKNATLHIINLSGAYVGPVVLPSGSRAYTKVQGTTGSIGGVRLKSGFATVAASKASSQYVLRSPITFSRTSGPSGASKLGLVQSSSSRIRISSTGGDGDKDGIPSVLDVDDDGDLILDSTDTSTGSTSTLEGESFSTLRLELRDSLNVNTPGFVSSTIDSIVQQNLRLEYFVRNNSTSTISVSSVNVDCQSLPHCTSGGGASIIDGPSTGSGLTIGGLWTSYDPDADGFPNLYISNSTSSTPANITIRPSVPTSSLKPGDTVLFKIKAGTRTVTLPVLLPFYFLSSPAVKEFTDGTTTRAINYPVDANDDGTSANRAFDLNSANLTLTFWRPQRPVISGAESGSFVDMGGLKYGVLLTFQGSVSNDVVRCTASDYSNQSSSLEVISGTDATDQIFRDNGLDTASSSSNTLAFTLNLATCLSRAGISTTSTRVNVDLVATSEKGDQASQQIWYRLPSP